MGDIMYKIYLRNNNFTKEIRRFNMPRQADFNAFRQKLKTMFPTINNKNFTISWNDGPDTVSISSDEEFKIANREMISISKINVDIQSQENESMNTEERVNTEKVIHYGVSCDGCDNIVVGFRYKCVECENFDLCSECEAANKHPEHYMLRMPQPLDWHHNRRFFHHLGKFLKKSGIECNRKRHGSDRTAEFSSRTIHRHIYPWMEASLPYLNNFIDTLIEAHIPNDNSSNTQQTEKEQQSNEETTTNKNKNEDDSKKSSGEEKKLSDEKDDKVSQSDTASVASQVSSMAQSSAPEEWTIVDNNETSEVNETPTTSSGVTVTSIKQIPTTSMAPSAPSAPGQTFSTSNVYPELPKEKEIFHPDPTIHNAIEAMIRMGFSNQGGLLTYLLSHEKGDINRVLEILQPTKK